MYGGVEEARERGLQSDEWGGKARDLLGEGNSGKERDGTRDVNRIGNGSAGSRAVAAVALGCFAGRRRDYSE